MADQDEAKECVVLCDASCRGNPGPASAGAVLWFRGGGTVPRQPDRTKYEELGEATSNVAEHRALQLGLELAWEEKARLVYVFTDSQLVVGQINGSMAVKSEALQPLVAATLEMMQMDGFEVVLAWCPRELTGQADIVAGRPPSVQGDRDKSLRDQIAGG